MAPDTVRIMLSGYTELGSVTDAINEGAIYKFLTKPWDDAVLTESVREAFQRKALIDDNHRLHERLKRAKDELARHNAGLTEALRTQRRSLERGEQVLRLATEGLDQIPVPVIGIDRDGRVAFVNRVAWEIGSPEAWRLGEPVSTGVPAMIAECVRIAPVQFTIPSLFGQEWILDARVVGEGAERRGIMVTLLPLKPTDWVGPKCC
jgi:PAS domain-containing protein